MERTDDNFLSKALTTLILAIILCAVVVLTIHALKHTEAQAIRQCMDENGPFAQWLERDGCAKHNLVKLPNGKVGDQITIEGEDGRTYELTSYCPKGGVLCKVENWLAYTKRAVKLWQK